MSTSSRDITDKPHTDADPDTGKPESPTKLTGGAWKVGLKRAAGEFSKDNCTDLAASLTYFAVLSLFPALLAVVSLLGVFGQGQATVDAVMGLVEGSVPEQTLNELRGPIEGLVNTPAAGIALITGILGALWTASGYVGAFGRAMNRIYEVEEGRPFWKLKPLMILLTAVLLILVALAGVMLVVSGPIAEWVGDLIGLGSTAVTVWGIAKWPALVLVVVVILAVLYGFAPNVKQPKFRWISLGAVVALVVWGLATVGFFFYVSNFGSYNATYGSLASSSSCCGCGSPTTPSCSVPRWTPRWSAPANSRRACTPRRPSSSRRATPPPATRRPRSSRRPSTRLQTSDARPRSTRPAAATDARPARLAFGPASPVSGGQGR